MGKFKTALRGYDKKEVDTYLFKLTEHQESKLRELEECISRLKEENDYLYAKNGEYHRNEERVSSAILKAMEIKNDLEKELKKKIELEEDRLRIFKTKWIAYARGLHRANADRVIDEVEEYISAFRDEFIHKANRELDLPEQQLLSAADRSYLAEKERIERNADCVSPEKTSAASLIRETTPKSETKGKSTVFFEE